MGLGGRIVGGIFVVLLSFVNLLLPIERGFPLVRIGPLPLYPSIVLTIVLAGVMFIMRPMRTLKDLRYPPMMWQIAFSLLIFIRAIFTTELNKGVATGIIYGATWVVTLGLLLSLIDWLGRQRFAAIYVPIAGIGAVLGILEGLFSIILPPYQAVRTLYAISIGTGIGGVGRADGPMGNSILFAFVMVLSIPFAFDLKPRWLRWMFASLFVFATLLTIARIGLLMLFVLSVGALLQRGRRARRAIVGLLLSVALIFSVAVIFADNPNVQRWTGRLAGGSKSEAAKNVQFRQDAIGRVADNVLIDGRADIVVWGEGPRAGDHIGQRLHTNVDTLDNAFVTIVYELGILGLLIYAAAHWYYLRNFWTKYGPARLYWFGAVAALAGGVAFVSIYTATPNLPFVASIAVLFHEERIRRRRSRLFAAGLISEYVADKGERSNAPLMEFPIERAPRTIELARSNSLQSPS